MSLTALCLPTPLYPCPGCPQGLAMPHCWRGQGWPCPHHHHCPWLCSCVSRQRGARHKGSQRLCSAALAPALHTKPLSTTQGKPLAQSLCPGRALALGPSLWVTGGQKTPKLSAWVTGVWPRTWSWGWGRTGLPGSWEGTQDPEPWLGSFTEPLDGRAWGGSRYFSSSLLQGAMGLWGLVLSCSCWGWSGAVTRGAWPWVHRPWVHACAEQGGCGCAWCIHGRVDVRMQLCVCTHGQGP